MRASKPLLLFAAALTAACSTGQLKNTKRLAYEGHLSLYRNGALRVPNTEIALIPPGPSGWGLAMRLMGVRARQSLQESLRHAAQSVCIVSEGTELTYRAAKDLNARARLAADAIRERARPAGTLLVYRSSELGKSIIGKPWELSKTAWREAGKIAPAAATAGDAIGKAAAEHGLALAGASRARAGELSAEGAAGAKAAFEKAGQVFVLGYVAVPARMKERGREARQALSDADFEGVLKQAGRSRSDWSRATADVVVDAVREYPHNVADSFRQAGRELARAGETGVSFAMLRSLRWVLQGTLGDATILPAAGIAAGSLGYIGANAVAFPCLVLFNEGMATATLAVEVSWDATEGVYQLVAPSGKAAVAGVYGLLKGLGSQAHAGAVAAGGAFAGYGEAALGKAADVVVKAGGTAAGKTTQYIGVPLASAGIALGRGTIGAVVGGGGIAAGKALRVGGETAGAAAQGFGNVLSGVALAGGTAASVGAAGGYDFYELSKAAIVPPSYELAGGIVLDYDTLSQLSAQSLLAASDCAYMVLSLEGPRWVLYAVKGKTGDGEDLPAGAVVDLKKMQRAGEDIYDIPVTDPEMQKVVDSIYKDLPELPPGAK